MSVFLSKITKHFNALRLGEEKEWCQIWVFSSISLNPISNQGKNFSHWWIQGRAIQHPIPPTPEPLSVKFLLFPCSFRQKFCKIIGRHFSCGVDAPVWEILDLPLVVFMGGGRVSLATTLDPPMFSQLNVNVLATGLFNQMTSCLVEFEVIISRVFDVIFSRVFDVIFGRVFDIIFGRVFDVKFDKSLTSYLAELLTSYLVEFLTSCLIEFLTSYLVEFLTSCLIEFLTSYLRLFDVIFGRLFDVMFCL